MLVIRLYSTHHIDWMDYFAAVSLKFAQGDWYITICLAGIYADRLGLGEVSVFYLLNTMDNSRVRDHLSWLFPQSPGGFAYCISGESKFILVIFSTLTEWFPLSSQYSSHRTIYQKLYGTFSFVFYTIMRGVELKSIEVIYPRSL